jgi:flavin-dependent dehydrogenase
MNKLNVIIVGGGFAGLSTALHICKEADASVLLIDEGEIGDPRKSSPFTFPDIIRKYELDKAVLQQYNGFSYETPTGVSAHFHYDYNPLVTVDYQKTCATLLQRAQKSGNLQILENTKVIRFIRRKSLFRPSKLKIITSSSEEIASDVIVDASGVAFFVPRQLGVRLPSLYSHPYGEVLTGCNISDPTRMHIFCGRKYGNGGGWLYPLDETRARFGFATVTDSPEFPTETVIQNFKNALEGFHPYNKMLANSKRVRPEFGTIPIGPLRHFVYDNIMIVGDAAGQATPWYNEGMRPALEAGELCAAAIVNAHRKNNYSKKNLNKYQDQWDRRNRKPYHMTVKYGSKCWFRSQSEWDEAVSKRLVSIPPQEMLDRIRYNKF